MDKAYSTNDEEYNYTDAGDALQALADDGQLEVGRSYYEMDWRPAPTSRYLSADRILENAQEQILDDIGDSADDAFLVSKDAEAELDGLLDAWATKHLRVRNYWEFVGKSRVLKVTAEDVAEYAI